MYFTKGFDVGAVSRPTVKVSRPKREGRSVEVDKESTHRRYGTVYHLFF